MMTIRTAADLKAAYKVINGGHFFDRSSMRFFGDSMSNYYVPVSRGRARAVEIETNSGFVKCYALERKKPVRHGRQDTAYFNIETLEVERAK